MKIKKISRILALGTLINSFNLCSYASTLSDDTRYETFNNSSITVNDVLEENQIDLKIEGNTMVSPLKNAQYRAGYSTVLGDLTNGIVNELSPNGNYFMYDSVIDKSLKLKKNTVYTVMLEGKVSFSANETVDIVPFYMVEGDSGLVTRPISYNVVRSEEYFSKKKVFTTTNENMHNFGFYINPYQNVTDINIYYHIVEGDYSNVDVGYFEGIKSSFENQLVTQEIIDNKEEKQENLGKYKVEVKSTGKNLFNPIINEENNNSETNGGCTISYKDNAFTVIGNSDNDGTKETYNDLWYLRQKLKPNTRYSLSYSSDGVFGGTQGEDTVEIYLYNIDEQDNFIYNDISPTRVYPKGTSFVTGDTGIITLRFDINKNNSQHKFYNLQIEEGTTATPYEPYKESITTFYLNSPLLEEDTIEYINGQAIHIRRYNSTVLNGSEGWKPWNTDVNIETIRFHTTDIHDGKDYGVALSDQFRTRMGLVEPHSDTEYIGMVGSDSRIYINILASRLQTVDLDGFKQWLSVNPVKVVYQLAEPIYEPIKADLSVQLFEGTTHISNNSNIPANMEITVDRTINRATEAIEIAKANPTVDNISTARMWINLLKESAKKDELHNQIDNITEIEDLEIELKKVTANMDVYIKSQNGLSMSLSTNSIVFDEFDSTQDMEKLNAVNLTINSSLPYQLNSYMMTELKNKDNTNIIPRELLNIRLSGETDYKAFTNINEKLVLKEDCVKGNDNRFNIDLILRGSLTHKADVYKTTLKFEVEQK